MRYYPKFLLIGDSIGENTWNLTDLKTPAAFNVSLSDLTASEQRSASGLVVRDRIGTKRTLSLTYNALTDKELRTILEGRLPPICLHHLSRSPGGGGHPAVLRTGSGGGHGPLRPGPKAVERPEPDVCGKVGIHYGIGIPSVSGRRDRPTSGGWWAIFTRATKNYTAAT